ncbi:16348_t:CDS:2 [Cetraspora pellucida]|uniref:16348_t:CDS:1 n=1 Tax=Cetraspora pellucida TaxID=1433469 RepID=A0ACA9LJI8_9GLOM|nr:16348_t:CDS:2 [Cetraspora pellucida]
MDNHNAQDYIDKKYPINGACSRNADPENKGKRREEITKLDVSKGKAGGGETIFVKKLRSEPKQNSSQKFKQERNANGNQERNTNGNQERNTNSKQERNTNVKQERNTNKRIEQELSTKRSRLKKLHFDLSLKFKEYLARTVTKYLFKSHKMFVEGKDVEGYYSKNLANLRNGLGSDTEGHKILDQIISVQNEIIDLEKKLESTTSQVGSPPPYHAI